MEGAPVAGVSDAADTLLGVAYHSFRLSTCLHLPLFRDPRSGVGEERTSTTDSASSRIVENLRPNIARVMRVANEYFQGGDDRLYVKTSATS